MVVVRRAGERAVGIVPVVIASAQVARREDAQVRVKVPVRTLVVLVDAPVEALRDVVPGPLCALLRFGHKPSSLRMVVDEAIEAFAGEVVFVEPPADR